jgi:hypothetical protein
MTIKLQRGRQFAATDSSVALFDDKGKAGTYLSKASDKLAAQGIAVTVRNGRKAQTLATAADWKAFIDTNCSTKEQTGAAFTKKFGITFSDFVNALDDAAASDDKGLKLDLRPTSAFAKALSLDKVDGDYATKLAKDATLALTGTAAGVTGQAQAAGVPTIGKDILANAISANWERDRTEMENWGDFQTGNGASDLFKANTGPAPYAKLYQPKWDDAKSMEIVNAFALPLHLEVKGTNPDGTTKFQDGYEMFRDTYFDDRNGSLGKAGASVRARVRFDNNPPFNVNRVLVQAKEGRAVTGTDSQVHKFEKRWEGNFTDENAAKGMLVNGKEDNGSTLAVSQKLYKLVSDKGTLPPDGNLRLEEKYTVLQKRRRTHLQLDSVSEVQSRRTGLQTQIDALKTANSPVPQGLTDYAAKLDAQVKFLTDAGAMLQKYGQYMPSGECFIVSADRYNVYDMAARQGTPPTDTDDTAGLIGKGPLHVEAEWDTNSSDPFEKAVAEVDKRLAAATDPAAKTTLTADRASLEGMRATFRKDVAQTVEVVKKQLLAQGLKEDPEKKSKEDRASDLASSAKRPTFWL